jgi:nitroreductase / dihydropteridine reductase
MEHVLTQSGIKPILVENALHWRYATKIFDSHMKVDDEKFELLLETLRLSPSSIGMQPWKFIIVKKKSLRKELYHLSMQQPQMVDASHLIVLCSLKNISASYVNKLVELEKERNKGISHLEDFIPFALSFIESKSKDELREWMTQQVYIALGFLLCTCALLHIDACPMEAFDQSKANKLLDLSKYGVESRVAVAIGYRSSKDQYSRRNKLRWDKEEVIVTV